MKLAVKRASFIFLAFVMLTMSYGGVDAASEKVDATKEPSIYAHPIYIAPIDRATFIVGALFDFRVELHELKAMPKNVSVTVNGIPAETFFGRSFVRTNTYPDSLELTIENVYFREPGTYTVSVQADDRTRTIHYDVIRPDDGEAKAKNIIFFLGDGMGQPSITTARIMSRGITEGKPNGLLTMDTFEQRATVITHGMDSIVTDSANAMSAYMTGHKTVVNAMGVYPDNRPDPLAKPKVEVMGEIMKRLGKSVGIVTTTELQDATPAAVVSHTRRRETKAEITEMFYQLKPEVMLGGGAAYFLPKSVPGSKRKDDKDFFRLFEQDGYRIVENRAQLLQIDAKKTDRLLGLFSRVRYHV
ncbi:alkaline phosphatase [Hydrogenibacillus schlegelii]|uniref:Alkaline phosphatase n=1 Tax=Hydrogenibacillus schlegelii TaxID=1484 RepID=A0A179IM76_HYDSH|nr:alkaline phosphatase [Hydrogenibacillus schlegelii]OAR03465.1 hypothetical protein SA87_01730 [Hydrogenibacillus schlegelii]